MCVFSVYIINNKRHHYCCNNSFIAYNICIVWTKEIVGLTRKKTKNNQFVRKSFQNVNFLVCATSFFLSRNEKFIRHKPIHVKNNSIRDWRIFVRLSIWRLSLAGFWWCLRWLVGTTLFSQLIGLGRRNPVSHWSNTSSTNFLPVVLLQNQISELRTHLDIRIYRETRKIDELPANFW